MQSLTKHWREIFDPAAQIFLNSNVMIQIEQLQITHFYKLNKI